MQWRDDPPPSWPPPQPGQQADRAAHDRAAHGWVSSRLRHLSLEEKVGQLFVTYAYGQQADTADPADVAANQEAYGVDSAAELVDRYKLGGVIYFTWSNNLAEPVQIAELSNGLQRAATSQRLPIPLLISTDQEQGVVTRVGPPATQFPGAMALGASRAAEVPSGGGSLDPSQDAYDAANVTGIELRAMGINQNYAPVADVNVNPLNPVIGVRSFGERPGVVAELTAAQVDGYEDARVAATTKHFPGHGDTAVDSHIGVPLITHTREEWEQIDAPPFEAAIEQGVDSIMTAHIVVPSLDPSGDPATLSHPILTGVLREELGFRGVVVTDALTMQGVREAYGDDRVPVLALQAGADQLLMPPDLDLAYESVLAAVRSGELSERRIDQSVYRILRLKLHLGLFHQPFVDPAVVGSVVGAPEHLELAQQVSDRTVTLVRDDADLVPLAASQAGDVLVTGWGTQTTAALADAISARGPSVSAYPTGSSPDQAQIDEAVSRAGASDLAVVTTNRAWRSGPQQALVQALVATGTPVVVVAVRDPYDVAYLPAAPTYLATYSYSTVSLESVARVLLGEVAPAGRLPVTVPAADDPSTVLYPYGHGLPD